MSPFKVCSLTVSIKDAHSILTNVHVLKQHTSIFSIDYTIGDVCMSQFQSQFPFNSKAGHPIMGSKLSYYFHPKEPYSGPGTVEQGGRGGGRGDVEQTKTAFPIWQVEGS